MYFIAVEIERNGYIVGSYDNFIDAEFGFEKIIQASNKYSFNDTENFNNELSDYRKYQIMNEQFFNGKDKLMATNGILSVYIFKLGDKWETVDAFIDERSFQAGLFLI